MFDKGILKAIIFLLVILLGACLMSVDSGKSDGFFVMPSPNKELTSKVKQDEIRLKRQSEFRKVQNDTKIALQNSKTALQNSKTSASLAVPTTIPAKR